MSYLLEKIVYICIVFRKRHCSSFTNEFAPQSESELKNNYLRSMRFKRRLLHKIVKAVQSLFVIW